MGREGSCRTPGWLATFKRLNSLAANGEIAVAPGSSELKGAAASKSEMIAY
jgi:hypothetical protein